MRERPDGLSDDELVRGLADGWGLKVSNLTFLPVGAGGYHWAADERWFVTVDVTTDPERLSRALSTAAKLDLPFVLAPVPARDGAAIQRLTPRHTLTVYPLVDGVAGEFGPHPPADRERVLDLLIALHRATPADAPRTDLRLPGRAALEQALSDLGSRWDGGPYSERARRELSSQAGRVRGWLGQFDRLAGCAGDPAGWVLTHGEPHPGNVLRTRGRRSGARVEAGHGRGVEPEQLWLIDWDTVMVAPAERDLWMLTGHMIGATEDDPALLKRYEGETGRAVSAELIAFYRLWWVLADIAIYVGELRRPHDENADLAASLSLLTGNLRA